MTILIVLFVLFWLTCAFFCYPIEFAYWQRKWPNIAEKWKGHDQTSAFESIFFPGLLGPFGLLLVLTYCENGKYGLKFK